MALLSRHIVGSINRSCVPSGNYRRAQLPKSFTYSPVSTRIGPEDLYSGKDHRDTILQLHYSLDEHRSLLATRDLHCAKLLSEKDDLEEFAALLQQTVQVLEDEAKSAQLEIKQAQRRAGIARRQRKARRELNSILEGQLKKLRELHAEVYGAPLDEVVDSTHRNYIRIFRAIRTFCSRFWIKTSTEGRPRDREDLAPEQPPWHTTIHSEVIGESSLGPPHQENAEHEFEPQVVEGCMRSRMCRSFLKRIWSSERPRQSWIRRVRGPAGAAVPSLSPAPRAIGRKHILLDWFGFLGVQNVSDEGEPSDGHRSGAENHRQYGRFIPGRSRSAIREVEAVCAQIREANARNELARENDGIGNLILRKQAEVDELAQHLVEVVEYTEMLEKKVLQLERRRGDGGGVGSTTLDSDSKRLSVDLPSFLQLSDSIAESATESATETTAEATADYVTITEVSTEYLTDGAASEVSTEQDVELIAECSTEYLTDSTGSGRMTQFASFGTREENDNVRTSCIPRTASGEF